MPGVKQNMTPCPFSRLFRRPQRAYVLMLRRLLDSVTKGAKIPSSDSDTCPAEGRLDGTPHRELENPDKEKNDFDMSRSLCSDLNSDRLIMNTLFQEQAAAIQPLALRPKDAATALGISERLLYDWAHYRGLPVVRIDRTVLYPVDGLRQWLVANSQRLYPGDCPQISESPDKSSNA